MSKVTNKQYAVISGDIVASSKLNPKKRKKLHRVMNESSRMVRRAFKEIVPLNVDIFKGDSWQMLVLEPSKALRAALFYRATLRARMELHKLDTRMAIAIGKIDYIPKIRISEGHGEAYNLSGRALETLYKSKAGNMCFAHANGKLSETLDIIVRLIDAIATNWTDRQALAVSGAIIGLKQEEIAEKLWKKKISQQAVAQHLSRAGWYALEKGIDFFEKSLNVFNKTS